MPTSAPIWIAERELKALRRLIRPDALNYINRDVYAFTFEDKPATLAIFSHRLAVIMRHPIDGVAPVDESDRIFQATLRLLARRGQDGSKEIDVQRLRDWCEPVQWPLACDCGGGEPGPSYDENAPLTCPKCDGDMEIQPDEQPGLICSMLVDRNLIAQGLEFMTGEAQGLGIPPHEKARLSFITNEVFGNTLAACLETDDCIILACLLCQTAKVREHAPSFEEFEEQSAGQGSAPP